MKTNRQTIILDIINHHDIETQKDLTKALLKKGLKVTQATVSRDIKELRLIKVANEKGNYKYAVAHKPKSEQVDERQISILSQSVHSIEFAQNIIVIKTISGMAQAAAFVIDSMNFAEIIGSIAGDDTIMCVTRTEAAANVFAEKINALIG